MWALPSQSAGANDTHALVSIVLRDSFFNTPPQPSAPDMTPGFWEQRCYSEELEISRLCLTNFCWPLVSK